MRLVPLDHVHTVVIWKDWVKHLNIKGGKGLWEVEHKRAGIKIQKVEGTRKKDWQKVINYIA